MFETANTAPGTEIQGEQTGQWLSMDFRAFWVPWMLRIFVGSRQCMSVDAGYPQAFNPFFAHKIYISNLEMAWIFEIGSMWW